MRESSGRTRRALAGTSRGVSRVSKWRVLPLRHESRALCVVCLPVIRVAQGITAGEIKFAASTNTMTNRAKLGHKGGPHNNSAPHDFLSAGGFLSESMHV